MTYPRLLSFLFFFGGLCIATTVFAADNVKVTENARRHFHAGVAYLDDPAGPKYEEAYREFHLAYADSPAYRILSNIGLCALNLERDGEAIEAYEGFLAKALPEDISPAKRAIMERDITTLKASLVTVTLSSRPAGVVLNDERITSKGTSVVNRYEVKEGRLVLGIHPGHHRITASAPGVATQTWDFDANSASSHQHEFALVSEASGVENAGQVAVRKSEVVASPQTPAARKTPALVYVGAVLSGAFAVQATVTGLLANSKYNEYERVNSSGNREADAQDLRTSGKRLALFTDIGIGAAALSAIGTVVVYFSAPNKKPTQVPAARVRVVPSVGQSQAFMSIRGEF